MSELTITRPALHTAQQVIARHAARFRVLACGRRWGKTTLAVHEAIIVAASANRVAYCTPTYKMLREVWKLLLETLHPIVTASNRADGRLELLTGGVVEFWSLDNANALRGRSYDLAIIDEAAAVPYLDSIWQNVLRPTLTDRQGRALFCSTPRGRNFFWELYQRGQDGNPDWASWQQPTRTNPHLPLADLEQAQRELSERVWLQEYEAAFLEDGAGVFRRVRENATAAPQPPRAGHDYIIGVDWGKHADFTVMVVLDTNGTMVALERLTRIDYALQVATLHGLARRYRPLAIVAERNSIGDPLLEQLQRDGLPMQGFTTTNASKAQAIEALALALEQGTLTILDHPVLIAELLAFEAERLPSGMTRYAAPQGMHDDCVMALALAWYGCAKRVGRLLSYV